MIKKYGLCENVGNCRTADSKIPVEITKAGDAICPECGEDLEGNKPIPWKIISSFALLLLFLLGAALIAQKWIPSTTQGNVSNDNKPFRINDNTNTLANQNPLVATNNSWKSGVLKRGYIIMGVQADADPMNYTGKNKDDEDGYNVSSEAWEEAKGKGEKGELERHIKELKFNRTGFDYDFMKLLAKEMDFSSKKDLVKAREVEEFKELFSLIDRREANGEYSVDLIMSGVAKDDTYSNSIDWSDPYLDLYYSLVTEKNSRIRTIADCSGKKIGIVESDNVVKRFVENQIPGAQPVPLSDATDDWMTNALSSGTVDAVIQDYPFAVSETAAAEGKLEIRIASLKGNDPQYDPQYVIGVRKGDTELRDNINKAISNVKKSEAYKKLIQSYLASKNITTPEIKAGMKIYKIKRGDTLSKIAQDELRDSSRYEELRKLNSNIPNDYLIFAGDRLIMPDDWEGNSRQ